MYHLPRHQIFQRKVFRQAGKEMRITWRDVFIFCGWCKVCFCQSDLNKWTFYSALRPWITMCANQTVILHPSIPSSSPLVRPAFSLLTCQNNIPFLSGFPRNRIIPLIRVLPREKLYVYFDVIVPWAYKMNVILLQNWWNRPAFFRLNYKK